MTRVPRPYGGGLRYGRLEYTFLQPSSNPHATLLQPPVTVACFCSPFGIATFNFSDFLGRMFAETPLEGTKIDPPGRVHPDAV